jgi:hypothetical protein
MTAPTAYRTAVNPKERSMRRPSIIAATVIAVALVAVDATGGHATTGARTRTIHLTLKEVGGFDSPGPPHPGFVHAFTDKVTSSDGSKGHDVGLCTLITNSELLCHSEVILSTGQLAFQGVLHQRDRNTPGSTGAYDGARGTATITTVNPTTTKVTVKLSN